MKKSSLLLTTAVIAGTGISGVDAKAYDFNDKIYGKATASIGYSLEHVQGDVLEENNLERPFGLGSTDYLHNLGFSLGYNFYFKVTDLIHPFVGLEFTVRAPLKVKTRDVTKQKNYFSADLKAGVKFNQIAKNISIQPYGVFGYALLNRHNLVSGDTTGEAWVDYFPDTPEKVNALNYGAGCDVIYDINDKIGLIGGFQYKRVKALDKTKTTNFLLETDQFEFKFGVQFL